MTELVLKYSDLRLLDTVVWRPRCSRVRGLLLDAFATSSFTEVAVFLGSPTQRSAAWFVPGRTSRVCSIPEAALESVETYALRPRGQNKAILTTDVMSRALDMASEPVGHVKRSVDVDKWSNFVLWLPFKVDSVLLLWSEALANFDAHVGKYDSFEDVLRAGLVEEIGRS